MREISKHLKEDSYRFVLIKEGGKLPEGTEWNVNGSLTNYKFSDKILTEALEKGRNVGICLGDGIVGLDCDDVEMEKWVEENLPETHTIKTASGAKLYLYSVDYSVLTKKSKYGEIRGLAVTGNYSQSLIPPSSKVFSNRAGKEGDYETTRDIPLTLLPKEKLELVQNKFFVSEVVSVSEEDKKELDEQNKNRNWEEYRKAFEYFIKNELGGKGTGIKDWVQPNMMIVAVKLNIPFEEIKEGLKSQKRSERTIANCKSWYKDAVDDKRTFSEGALRVWALKNNKEFLKLLPNTLEFDISQIIRKFEIGEVKSKDKKKIKTELFTKLAKCTDALERQGFVNRIAKSLGVYYKDVSSELMKYEPKKERRIREADDLANEEVIPKKWIIEDFIEENTLSGFFGVPGKGKSMLLLHLALSIKYRDNFLDRFNIIKQKNILYYALEEGEAVYKERIQYYKNGKEITTNSKVQLNIVNDFNSLNPKEEVDFILENKYGVVIVDTLRGALNGDENKSEVCRDFYEKFFKPLLGNGVTILYAHHLNKGSHQEVLNLIRGSTDIVAQLDNSFLLRANEDGKTNENGVQGIELSLSLTKDKRGNTFRDFIYLLEKHKEDRKTICKFVKEGRFEEKKVSMKQQHKEKIENKIIELLKDKKETRRMDISDELIKSDVLSSDNSVGKYLARMIKEGTIEQEHLGYYKLPKAKEEHPQKSLDEINSEKEE